MMHGFIREREFARESPADARGSAADPHGYGGEIHRRIRDFARKFIHSGYALVRIERARDVDDGPRAHASESDDARRRATAARRGQMC